MQQRTARLRALPNFVIIGAQKAGTTSLYEYLRAHPQVLGTATKELHHFDFDGPDPGLTAYRAHFPLRFHLRTRGVAHPMITGEATPIYLFDPRSPVRMAAQFPAPGPKLIAVLRDPVERAWSHYRMSVRLGHEPLGFVEALRIEDARLASWRADPTADHLAPDDSWRWHSYIARGLYAEQLERWFALFPRERVLVLQADHLFRQPASAFAETERFLGLDPFEDITFEVFNAGDDTTDMPSEARSVIEERIADDQARLRDVLDPAS